MKTDLQIAQECTMEHIEKIAQKAHEVITKNISKVRAGLSLF